jgi:tetratricopeptide (TPR) repeat protein
VDQQTRHQLKNDQFVEATKSGMEWASANRKSVTTTAAILLGVIVLLVGGGAYYSHRSTQAQAAFGVAMQTYQTPLAQASQPAEPGTKTFASAAERSKAANSQFMDVADKYGSTKGGKVARYFGGLTYLDEGNYVSAETTLNQVAGGWDHDLAALAKLALAQMYRQTGRNQQAIEIYNELTAKPTATVSAGMAQLQLADLYASAGKTEEAKRVYAQLKDKDAKGPAGMAAAQKLETVAQQ